MLYSSKLVVGGGGRRDVMVIALQKRRLSYMSADDYTTNTRYGIVAQRYCSVNMWSSGLGVPMWIISGVAI